MSFQVQLQWVSISNVFLRNQIISTFGWEFSFAIHTPVRFISKTSISKDVDEKDVSLACLNTMSCSPVKFPYLLSIISDTVQEIWLVLVLGNFEGPSPHHQSSHRLISQPLPTLHRVPRIMIFFGFADSPPGIWCRGFSKSISRIKAPTIYSIKHLDPQQFFSGEYLPT